VTVLCKSKQYRLVKHILKRLKIGVDFYLKFVLTFLLDLILRFGNIIVFRAVLACLKLNFGFANITAAAERVFHYFNYYLS